MHLSLALACLLLGRRKTTAVDDPSDAPPTRTRHALALAFLSGGAAFILEVSWFRSLRSAWFSTSDSLAVMLFCFLVALALGAAAAPVWRRKGWTISLAFAGAAALVVLATPLLGRFDLVDAFQAKGAWRQLSRTLAGLAVIGPPVALIGLSLPTLLDEVRRPRDWAVLYAVNTLGAVVGANAAAWLLLEWIGPAAASWVAGALLALGAWIAAGSRAVGIYAATGFVLALAAAVWFERGEWRRVPGAGRSFSGQIELIERRHGPDATISVVGYEGGKALFINGFATTAESSGSTGASDPRFRYMESIGRLPMLLHPNPHDALVICFGTGQTAHSVRDEGPQRLDLADLNAAVFELGRHFESNHRVLDDPRVRKVVMDGRAWLRRTEQDYDVVTLEPMPPFFSGSNALYSTEFYHLVHSRLRPGGLLAQWFPLHLMTPEQAKSVAASFVEAFPDTILWMDPGSLSASGLPDQGILVGRKPLEGEAAGSFREEWPGYARPSESGRRSLTATEAKGQVALDAEGLRRFVAESVPVTDDNQLLEYGSSPYRESRRVAESIREIHARIGEARADGTP